MKRSDLAYRVRDIIVVVVVFAVKFYNWDWQEFFKRPGDSHGTSPGSPATVRGREGLVKIKMKNVKPHVARPDLSPSRVDICPVVVEKPTSLVDDFRNL